MRDIKEKSKVYINWKGERQPAIVDETMSVREAKKRGLYEGNRKNGTFLMLRLESGGKLLGRHKSKVYMTKK